MLNSRRSITVVHHPLTDSWSLKITVLPNTDWQLRPYTEHVTVVHWWKSLIKAYSLEIFFISIIRWFDNGSLLQSRSTRPSKTVLPTRKAITFTIIVVFYTKSSRWLLLNSCCRDSTFDCIRRFFCLSILTLRLYWVSADSIMLNLCWSTLGLGKQ